MVKRKYRLDENADDPSLSGRLPARLSRPSTRFKRRGSSILQIQADVGSLGVLPLEVIHCILQQLDIASLVRLKCTSKGIERAVRSLPKLDAIELCAPDVLRAIWASKTASLILCSDLYEKLCRPNCFMCNTQPGTYLYLLSCHRVCKNCLLLKQRYLPLRPSQACNQFALSMHEVKQLPSLRVPRYSPRARWIRCRGQAVKQRNTTRWVLIDREVVLREKLRLDHAKGLIDCRVFERETLKQVAQLHDKALDRGTAAMPFKLPTEYSYSAAVLFPWLDRATQNVGAPVKCRACRFASKRAEILAFYCETGLKDHVKKYGRIVDGEHLKPDSTQASR
ncbi:hypothetical protein PWT90_02643 [Aphanocladium album]|nr:hypothetical protein PWT90_02643 [Aphanocladium album]